MYTWLYYQKGTLTGAFFGFGRVTLYSSSMSRILTPIVETPISR
jgi:hypothetical protein